MTKSVSATTTGGLNYIGYAKINPRNYIGSTTYQTGTSNFNRAFYEASSSYDFSVLNTTKKGIYDPANDPDCKKTPNDIHGCLPGSGSSKEHWIILGCVGVGIVIAILLGLFFYYNPDKNPCV